MRSMKLMMLVGISSGLLAQQSLPADAVNRNALVEIEFDNLTDFYRWCRPNPESCLAALCSEVEALEPVAESIISVVDALELETCPVTLLYQSGVPYTLTASGRYCLAEDLTVDCVTTGTAHAAVTINGSGITLDLNGYSIILTCTADVGIAVDGDDAPNGDIVIKNGTVIGSFDAFIAGPTESFQVGIWLGADENRVNNVRIEDIALTNVDVGVYAHNTVATVINNATFHFDGIGISCQGDAATTITNATFFESGAGLLYCQSHNLIVRDCSFFELAQGIGSGGSNLPDNNCPQDNDFLDGAEFDTCTLNTCLIGIAFVHASSVVLRNCQAAANCNGGFSVTNSNDIVFYDCVSSENGRHSFNFFGHSFTCVAVDGFHINASTDVNLYNCFAQNNSGNGVHVIDSSVLVRNCTATYNGDYGFTDDADNTNQYYACYACNNDGSAANPPNNSSNYNNIFSASVTSPDNTRGVHNVDCSNSAVDQINTIESVVENISVVVDAVCSCSLIEAIVTDIDEQLFALSSAVDELAETGDDCSVKIVRNLPTQTLTKSGRYCLAEDVHGQIQIAANSVILDLNGHTIYGGGAGIDMVGTSTTNPLHDINIKNGSLVGSGVGIGAEFVNALRLEDISCTNCEFGIFLVNVDDVLLSNVVSYKNLIGLALNSVADLLAQSCLFNDNKVVGVVGGFESIGLFNSEFVNCIANSNGAGFGFAASSNVVLRDCFASHNHGNHLIAAGFIILESSMNICLYDCYAKSNVVGFAVDSTSTVLMRNCTAINNTEFGFFDGAGTNQYYANYACNNGINYFGVNSAPVTSPRNARDFSNVDCNNSDVDQICAIATCLPCSGASTLDCPIA